MAVYLVGTNTDADLAALLPGSRPVWAGAVMLESDEGQSRVYHAAKRALPAGASLFVARLDHHPKFKGVEPGLLAWCRERFGGMTA